MVMLEMLRHIAEESGFEYRLANQRLENSVNAAINWYLFELGKDKAAKRE